MRGTGLWVLALALGVAAGATENGKDPFLIFPGGKSGAITTRTSEADLIRVYGRDNLAWGEIHIGEGYSQPGTILFPGDTLKRLEVLWKDPEKRQPQQARISGAKSVWKTIHGITLGTSLKQLESINRRPFLLTGFEWDYSGTATSWRDGVLESAFAANGRVLLRLMPAPGTDYRQMRPVLGDRDYSSGHPVMQKLNPAVYQIIWEFKPGN